MQRNGKNRTRSCTRRRLQLVMAVKKGENWQL
jgi:septum formation topological specificity factor MinE